MSERTTFRTDILLMVSIPIGVSFGQAGYPIKPNHPRLFIEDIHKLAQRCDGPLAEDYRVVKQRADDAVRRGDIQFISNQWSIPEDGSRTLFLHVFEITDEKVRQPTPVEFAVPAGVKIAQRWQVQFNPTGGLGGSVNDRPLNTTIKTETQYQSRDIGSGPRRNTLFGAYLTPSLKTLD
jgi:hypothetical protein